LKKKKKPRTRKNWTKSQDVGHAKLGPEIAAS
jgi:hypothetical protein